MSELALPIPYPLTAPEAIRRGVSFYAPLIGDAGSNTLRLRGSTSPSTESVDAVGTYVSAKDGSITQALNGVLRVERKGALLEGARTNLCLQARDFNTTWSVTTATVSTNDATVTAPDGSTNSDKLVEDSSDAVHTVAQSIAWASGSQYTFSCYCRADERSEVLFLLPGTRFPADVNAWFNLSTGIAGTAGAGLDGSGMEAVANHPGWYRCWITATASSTGNGSVQIYLGVDPEDNSYQGDGTSGLHLFDAQVEVGALPSSVIPTTTASVTRAADDFDFAITSDDVVNPAAGTILCAFTPQHDSADLTQDTYLWDWRTADNNNGALMHVDSAGSDVRYVVRAGSATVAGISTGRALSRGTIAVIAAVWAENNFRVYIDGAEEGTPDTSGAAPSEAGPTLFLGQSFVNADQAFGNISHVLIYDRVLSAGEIKSISDQIAGWAGN